MLKMIAAMDPNRLIGRNGFLPWSIPEELKHFKEVTMGGNVVMGSRTWMLDLEEKPLMGRENYVLTRGGYSKEDILNLVDERSDEDWWVIGGAKIYTSFLDDVDQLVISEIPDEYRGDVYFPQFIHKFYFVDRVNKGTFSVATYNRFRY